MRLGESIIKDRGMGEAHLMVSSKAIDSKVLGMAIQFKYFFCKKSKMVKNFI